MKLLNKSPFLPQVEQISPDIAKLKDKEVEKIMKKLPEESLSVILREKGISLCEIAVVAFHHKCEFVDWDSECLTCLPPSPRPLFT